MARKGSFQARQVQCRLWAWGFWCCLCFCLQRALLRWFRQAEFSCWHIYKKNCTHKSSGCSHWLSIYLCSALPNGWKRDICPYLLEQGNRVKFMLILLTPASYKLMSELFTVASRSFSSWMKIWRLSGVTFTSTHSEWSSIETLSAQECHLFSLNSTCKTWLTRGYSYVQGNKRILVPVVHVIHFVDNFCHLSVGNNRRLQKFREQINNFSSSWICLGLNVIYL